VGIEEILHFSAVSWFSSCKDARRRHVWHRLVNRARAIWAPRSQGKVSADAGTYNVHLDDHNVGHLRELLHLWRDPLARAAPRRGEVNHDELVAGVGEASVLRGLGVGVVRKNRTLPSRAYVYAPHNLSKARRRGADDATAARRRQAGSAARTNSASVFS